MTEDTLKARQKKEISRLNKVYKNLPKGARENVKKLIERAAYMLISLEDMEAKIDDDGLVVPMEQGSYIINRAHPLLQPYNTMVKNYNATVKQLNELLPSQYLETAGSKVVEFITEPKQTKRP